MPCDHNCAACGGCKHGGELELTRPEMDFLEELGQFAFLPVARRADDPAPLNPDGDAYGADEYSLILQLLEKKRLISIDFDKPLKNFSSEKYAPFSLIGSVALTERGQKVLEILQMQGISEECPPCKNNG